MRFLPTKSILTAVRKLIRAEGDVIAAVAYWGAGAVSNTGISRKRNGTIRILCDLFSGSCNPEEIKKAIRQNTTEVKTLDGLHAKVWLNGNTSIVGSANASINGLGFEDRRNHIPNIEAAFIAKDDEISREIMQWFENQWSAARRVLPEDLQSARDFWDHRQTGNSSGRAQTPTLLEKARTTRGFTDHTRLRVLAYKIDDYSDSAIEYWNNKGKLLYSQREHQLISEDYPLYEEPQGSSWIPPSGTVFLDLNCPARRRTFSCNGLWMVRDDGYVKLAQEGHLILLTPIPHYNGYRLPAQERRDVSRIAKCYLDASDWKENAGCYLDMSFGEFWTKTRRRCGNSRRRCASCPER